MQAPMQNWALFEEKCRPEHVAWLRSLTAEQAVSLCEELRTLAGQLTSDRPSDEQVTRQRWEDKYAMRRKLLAVFVALDRRRSE